MSEKIELLSCPFCGEIPRFIPLSGSIYHRIACSCGIIIVRDTEAEVIEAWNTRQSPWILMSDRLPDQNGTVPMIREALVKHVEKGDPVDVANFAMFLWNRWDAAGDSCHSDRDGDCEWKDCPQTRDGEPKATGRSCPIYTEEERA